MSALATAHVARLHYVDELSKQEIATRLGVSRFKVARLLSQARAEGIVRIAIDEPLAVDADAARALEARFGLDLAVVVTDGSAVAPAAAAWLPDLLRDGEPLGVGWGTTLAAVADALDAQPRLGVEVVQVCGAIAGLEPGTTPVELALRFAQRLGGPLRALPAPALASRRARDELLANEAVAPTVARWGDVGLVLAGIGTALPGAPARAAGHLLVQSFAADGTLLAARAAERAIAIGTEDLRRARVMAVAAGASKAEAVAGALRSGLLDVLVCDGAAARVALEDA
jgi:DNA-binding transcriptional regulator LsrR (DeoR family)